jgi:hypothetical protein
VEEEVPEVPEQELPPEPEPSMVPIDMRGDLDTDDEDIRKWTESFGDEDSYVKIMKLDSKGRLIFISQTDRDTACEVFLQENWGEGKYKLNLYKADNTYLKSKTLYIGPGKDKPRQLDNPQPADNSQKSDSSDLVLKMMIEQNRSNQQLLAEIIKAQGNNGKSGAQELAEIMAILQSSMPKPAEQPSTTKLLIEVLPVVKEIVALGKGITGGGGESRNWLDTIKEMAPELLTTMKQMSANKAAANAAAGSAPPMGNRPFHPTDTPPEGVRVNLPAAEPGEPEMDLSKLPGLSLADAMQLRTGIMFLKRQALSGKDPAVFVDFVLNTLDENQAAGLLKILDRQYEDVSILDPELLSPIYRPWFEAFLTELKNAISESDNSSGDPGDQGDVIQDAGPVPAGVQE